LCKCVKNRCWDVYFFFLFERDEECEWSWVDFTNILWAAFISADPKSAKRHWLPDSLFALLGSARLIAARKHVGKIDTRCQFHQRLTCSFEKDKTEERERERERSCFALFPGIKCGYLHVMSKGFLGWKKRREMHNFINVLLTAFTLADPKSVKRYWRLDWLLRILTTWLTLTLLRIICA